MANELNCSLPGQTGLTVTANTYLAGALVTSGISCPEVSGAGGLYSGNMTGGTAGRYTVEFIVSGVVKAAGDIDWDGTREVTGIVLEQVAGTYAITIPPPAAYGSLTPGLISGFRGDTLSFTNANGTLLGDIASRTKFAFTAKLSTMVQSSANTDSQAVLQVVEGVGLTVLNGISIGLTASNASLVVTNATTGVFVLTIAAAVLAVIPLEDLVYDFQVYTNSVIATPLYGSLEITPDVTQSTS